MCKLDSSEETGHKHRWIWYGFLHLGTGERTDVLKVVSCQFRDCFSVWTLERKDLSHKLHLVTDCLKHTGYFGHSCPEAHWLQWQEIFSLPSSLDSRVSALQTCRWMLWSSPARPDGAVSHKGRALLAVTSGSPMYKVLRDVKWMEKVDRKCTETRSFLLPLLKWAESAASPSLCCPQKDPGFGCRLVLCTAPDSCWPFGSVCALSNVRAF